MEVFVQSVGVLGPGLSGWTTSRAILAGLAPYRVAPTPRPVPDILPATERRRSGDAIRLAVAVAQEAMDAGGLAADSAATVFASSEGDGGITHRICEALAVPERDVSPTLFHNSVYNAPSGYWSIATGSRFTSTSLCAFDASFAAGLLEAAGHVLVEHQPVLLIAYDVPSPQPLYAVRPVEVAFAAALLLTPTATPASLMRCDLRIERGTSRSAMPDMLPERLWSNPAARGAPLLAALARRTGQTVWLEYVNGSCVAVCCDP
jgi:hypothetical protein